MGNQTTSKSWCQKIAARVTIPITLVDERNSTLEGNAQQSLISRFQPQTISNSNQNNDEDDLGNSNNNLPTQITSLENNGVSSRLKINLPTAYGLQISSVDNPPRIIIDSRPDAMDEKRIVWQPGLIWPGCVSILIRPCE